MSESITSLNRGGTVGPLRQITYAGRASETVAGAYTQDGGAVWNVANFDGGTDWQSGGVQINRTGQAASNSFEAMRPGLYEIEAQIEWEAAAAGNTRSIRLVKNVVTEIGGTTHNIASGGTILSTMTTPVDGAVASGVQGCHVAWMGYLDVGDKIYVEHAKQGATAILVDDQIDLVYYNVNYLSQGA